MKGRQFIRLLRKRGVEVAPKRGKGGHQLVAYKGRQAIVPMHGDQDLSPVFIKKVYKQLGLDPQ
ncbi:MAG: type II toxin-antitoxin system HicA family toxin [Nitrospinales bacterium]